MGQSVTRAISVCGRQPRPATTTAYLYGAFCQRRGGSVLNITSAEVLPTRCGDREKEDRENRERWRRRRRRRDEEGSQDRNHRLAFFSGFKHPLHQPPPDRLPLPPAALARAQRDVRALAHAFISPFRIVKDASDAFLPAALPDAFRGFRLVSGFSLSSCFIASGGRRIN